MPIAQDAARRTLTDERKRLEHRIALLKPGAVDPDLVEEIAARQTFGQRRPARSHSAVAQH